MASTPQPAKKSYFFDKGYKDLLNTIKGAWSRNSDSIKKYAANIKGHPDKSKAIQIFLGIVNVLAIVAVAVFGSIFTALFTVLNIVVLLTVMIVIYIGFSAIWLADRIYLKWHSIFTACHECKEKYLIPTYICPNCGAEHTNLTPGVYGILKRTCNCGEKLPTTFFNGRRKLDAICPGCRKDGKTTRLYDRETRPICIPVVGGRSVGKTAFITAFSEEFIEKVAPAKGMEIEFYNQDKSDIYKKIKSDFDTGGTRMTERPTDVRKASSVSFSFFVKHPSLKPERLVHVYDIAGEIFTHNSENEVQKQYEYCHGIVLIVDPFAIPEIRYKYEELLAPEDVAGIGQADINGVIDAFLVKLCEVTGMSDRKMSNTPLAVVISKIDSAGLEQDVGARAVNALMRKEPDTYTDFYDTQDRLCRQFLRDNGMEGFLSIINNRFKDVRYFACSAIGHTRDKGAYEPQGVLPIMEWIFKKADRSLGKLWDDTSFTKRPMKFE